MSIGMKIVMGAGIVGGMVGIIGGPIGMIIGAAAGVIFIGAPVGGIIEGIVEAKNKNI